MNLATNSKLKILCELILVQCPHLPSQFSDVHGLHGLQVCVYVCVCVCVCECLCLYLCECVCQSISLFVECYTQTENAHFASPLPVGNPCV